MKRPLRTSPWPEYQKAGKKSWEEASRFGIVVTDNQHKITEFEEKPANPSSNLASMGIYIFSYPALKEALIALRDKAGLDFGKHVIPYLHDLPAWYELRGASAVPVRFGAELPDDLRGLFALCGFGLASRVPRIHSEVRGQHEPGRYADLYRGAASDCDRDGGALKKF